MDRYSKNIHSGGLTGDMNRKFRDKDKDHKNLEQKIVSILKGFAPPKSQNDSNDINFIVYSEQDLWKGYSEDKKGLRYPVNAMYKDKHIGMFWIRLEVQ